VKATARIRVMCGNWRAWARTAGAVATMLIVSGPAHAFYWHNWPGSGVVVQQSLITQPHQNTTANPPSSAPPETVQPPGSPGTPPVPIGPPVPIDKPPVGPSPTPEPATGLLGLLGLGALAAARRSWNRK
jgi:MYXO-CTERM domain-containing protein